MTGSKSRSLLGRCGIEWGHFDAHRNERLSSIIDTRLASAGDQRLAVGTGWGYEIVAIQIGCLHLVDGTRVVDVSAVEKGDHNAGVQDQ